MEDISDPQNDNTFGLQLIDDQGNSIQLASIPATIGRGEENDVQLNDDTVSNNHARVYYDVIAEAVCIEDLGSLNGLYVENKPTRKNILKDGVQISIGTINLTFRDTGYIPDSTE